METPVRKATGSYGIAHRVRQQMGMLDRHQILILQRQPATLN
jgi:hypothetical protein